MFYLCVSVCVHEYKCPRRPKEDTRYSGAGVKAGLWTTWCDYWQPNGGSLQEQYTFLTTEPFPPAPEFGILGVTNCSPFGLGVVGGTHSPAWQWVNWSRGYIMHSLHVTMTLCEDVEEKQGRNMAFCLLHVYGGEGGPRSKNLLLL